MMPEEIEAVIFDWGGVLIDDPKPTHIKFCAKVLGVSEEQFLKAHTMFLEPFQKGLDSEETFWAKICAELDCLPPSRPSLWGEAVRIAYTPRKEMFALASNLHKAGYKTALLSNAEAPAVQMFYEHGYDMFDVAVFSCVEGSAKPESKIYQTTLDRLGSQPAQTVFIDDRPPLIDGARQLGINTILFESIDQTKDELARFGVQSRLTSRQENRR